MLTKMTSSSIRKPVRLAHVSLAALALLVIASPGLAASPQRSQLLQEGSISWANGMTGTSGMIDTISDGLDNRGQPDATCPPDGQCFADVPSSNAFYAFVNRIYMQDLVTGYPCGGPGELCDPYSRPYYRPNNNVTRSQMAKFIDNARHLAGILIDTANTTPLYSRTTATAGIGVIGTSTGTSGKGVRGSNTSSGIGVEGASISGTGVKGTASSGGGYGVVGQNMSGGYGIYGLSNGVSISGVLGENDAANGWGVYGLAQGSGGIAVRGLAASSTGYGVFGGNNGGGKAGYFSGDVQVTGNLSKGGGSFKIDDPLDPANKYLYHSFVESPDMMDIYNGNVTTDASGEAIVTLPDWFEALNKEFRYQLTPIGQFAQAIVASEVKGNSFTIKTDKPNVKVSWQVTGIRQDPYANAHRIPVEEDKPDNEKGKYLHPTEWGQPASSGIDYDVQQRAQQVTESKP
jgi:hypothetical protein